MSQNPVFDPAPQLAEELGLPLSGVQAVLALFAEGSTVPFIARYRKERTGGLDEVQIRAIQERATYMRELEERRTAVLKSIEEQGKLTDALRTKILACQSKQALEDLYLPYKPKRRTKATIAREKGLEPLAERILQQPHDGDPEAEAKAFVSEEKGVASTDEALEGARHIVAEVVAENADLRAAMRKLYSERGTVRSEAAPGKTEARTKFEDYYEYSEPVAKVPSHRVLAMRRGEQEGVLRVRVNVDEAAVDAQVAPFAKPDPSSPFAQELAKSIEDAVGKKIAVAVETDVRVDLKMAADRDAVEVFAENLENLLLAAPLGQRAVIGIDPGLRTGCKCVAVDHTGKFLQHITIYPARGEAEAQKAKAELGVFLKTHNPAAIAVGNGTGGRETEKLTREVVKVLGLTDVVVVQVSEAGASIYSASDIAREEFPDLDLTVRGAISIARRLQDPLSELVKLDPKSIGVGQYQHDVHQPLLQRKLHDVVESCVNRVGVELNTASPSLLSYVSGIGPSLAQKIVKHRESNGAFSDRSTLKKVPGLGPKAFEQGAGFLRVSGGKNPLDGSAVHPERYELVERIAADMGVELPQLVGNAALAKKIDVTKYVGDGVGEPTLRDIIGELQKPGRDPRAEFEPPKFRDDVNSLDDLKNGMSLEGVVTNVTNFGAFVDVGVHQDGLVHISELSDKFVENPKDVVKVGDRITVRVMDVDLERKRIALSAKSGASGQKAAGQGQEARGPGGKTDRQGRGKGQGKGKGKGPKKGGGKQDRPKKGGFANNPFASLLTRD